MDSGWTVDEEPYFDDERDASKFAYGTLRHAELTISERFDDVPLQASALVLIAHDLGLFEAAPETKSVLQYIPFWRLEPDVFS